MYKQYLNDYEKRAEQIRKAARAVENGGAIAAAPQILSSAKLPQEDRTVQTAQMREGRGLDSLFARFSKDDILILVLLFLLVSGEDKDMTLIVILVYLFISGL